MPKRVVEPSDETPDLGVAASLGLPLPPKARGRVYRLPPVKAVINGRVPLPADPLETDIETAVASIQSGRVRFAALIRRGLAWTAGTQILIEPVELRLGSAVAAPALVLRPSRKASSARLNDELRLTLRAPERRHLGIEESGDQLLLAFPHTDPKTVLALGSPGLSMLMSRVWPDALR